jgi:hypothetical protein
VGAHAVAHYANPRFTKDLDILIPPALNDAERTWQALEAFGAPLLGLTLQDFKDPDLIYQIGVAPVRVDIMTHVPGVTARTAWDRRKRMKFGEVTVPVIALDDLIRAKRRSGRPQDKLDLEALIRLRKAKRR